MTINQNKDGSLIKSSRNYAASIGRIGGTFSPKRNQAIEEKY